MKTRFDIAVVGGGLAGSMAALAAAAEGWSVAFIAPDPPGPDRRTTALLSESIALLDRLGIWQTVQSQSAALSTMRILDGTKRMFRAPPVSFRSSEIGMDAFGFNIPNAPLLAAARQRINQTAEITTIETLLADARDTETTVELTLADGTQLAADAVFGADGRKSRVREIAGISARHWSYNQTALVLNFAHTRPHHNISTEFHTEEGPFTQVPLPGNRSSLVWSMDPARIDDVLALPRADLNRRVEARMSSLLGEVEIDDGFQSYPMSGLITRNFAKGRIFLIGEAAHAFPPIGAQGLNLGIRDVEQAITCISQANGPENAKAAGLSFDQQRRLDVSSRTFGVDMLNRTLLTSFLPAQLLRAGGLTALGAIKPLKILAMKEGMTPGWRKTAERPSLRKMLREKVSR